MNDTQPRKQETNPAAEVPSPPAADVAAELARVRSELERLSTLYRSAVGDQHRLRLRVEELNTALKQKQLEFLGMLDRLQRREEEAVQRALRELTLSEERFRLLVEGIADYAIFLLDPSGTITSWNRGGERITGYGAEEVVGQPLSVLFPPEELLAGTPDRALRVAGDEGRWEDEGWRPRKDGGKMWASEVLTALRGDQGKLVGFVDITRDLTERMQYQRALEETAAELESTLDQLLVRTEDAERARSVAEDANRAKSDFLAVMSHELRTPLNAIIGYADLLHAEISGPLSPKQREQVGRISGSAGHLLGLIEEILNFSRLEAGKAEVHLEDVEVTTLLREVGEMLEPLARKQGLEFRVEYPPPPVRLRTDPAKLRQILLNLLSNAIKFTEEGSVGARLRLEDEAVFDVWDEGMGISPEALERIFDPFWQVEQSTTRRAGGTGLGLSVSRSLAHLLGGDITVVSTIGKGSVFTLYLPLQAREA